VRSYKYSIENFTTRVNTLNIVGILNLCEMRYNWSDKVPKEMKKEAKKKTAAYHYLPQALHHPSYAPLFSGLWQ
jgi:hypothetical protein